MPIDWTTVDWGYFGLLVLIVFLCSLIGSVVSFNRPGLGAVISAGLFAAAFIFWTYYPHHLPLPTTPVRTATVAPSQITVPPAAPAAPAAPARPASPVRDIAPR